MKGPYIFLVNAIGYELTGTKHGVWAVQSIFMFFTSLALFKMFRLYFTSGRSMCLTLLSLAALSYTYSGGNLTEEYVLPWLLFSFYNVELWEKRRLEETKKASHSPFASILYGITFGLCLMSRLTNVLALSGAIIGIALILIYEKSYRNIFQNSIAFLMGFILSSLPFFLYFMYHQTLQQMWNATFAYAVEYARRSSMDSLSNGIHYFTLSYIGSILLLLVTFSRILSKRHVDVYSWLWLTAAGLPFVWFCLGNGYGHYGMTVLPLFAIALTQTKMFSLSRLRAAIVVVTLIGIASKLLFITYMYHYENTDLKDYRTFLNNCPIVNYSSFVAYNCDPNIYLDLNIKPASPYFALQDMARSHTLSLPGDIIENYMENKPEWILIFSLPEHPPIIIHDILNEYYCIAHLDEERHLKLYQRIR